MEEIPVVVERLKGADDTQRAYCCMTEVPSPWPQALCQCRDWITNNLGKYVEGYHLRLESGEVIGHLYYAPSERALFPYEVEHGVGVLYCDWVQTRYQGRGLGKRLYDIFLGDLRAEGAKGVLVEATDKEGHMYYRHYEARGFKLLAEKEHRKLMFMPLAQEEVRANPLEPNIQPRRGTPVEILVLNGYMCPHDTATCMQVRGIAQEFGERVVLREEWLTPVSLHQYGVAKGIFINGLQKLFGAETEEAIRQAILEEL